MVYLKDPQAFFDHIVAERGLDREKVMVRFGLDGGQGSFKVVVSIFETDYDPEITFSEKEAPGTRLTGSSRMLMMALCDDLQVCPIFIGATFLDLILQESYENVRVVVEKWKLNDLDCCIVEGLTESTPIFSSSTLTS